MQQQKNNNKLQFANVAAATTAVVERIHYFMESKSHTSHTMNGMRQTNSVRERCETKRGREGEGGGEGLRKKENKTEDKQIENTQDIDNSDRKVLIVHYYFVNIIHSSTVAISRRPKMIVQSNVRNF